MSNHFASKGSKRSGCEFKRVIEILPSGYVWVERGLTKKIERELDLFQEFVT